MPPLSPREHKQFLFSCTPIGIQTCNLLAIMQTRFCCTTQEPCFFPLLSVKKTTYYIIHNLLDKNIIKAVRDYLQQHKQVWQSECPEELRQILQVKKNKPINQCLYEIVWNVPETTDARLAMPNINIALLTAHYSSFFVCRKCLITFLKALLLRSYPILKTNTKTQLFVTSWSLKVFDFYKYL